MKKKDVILVTGSSGYLANNLITELNKENYSIFGIQRSERKISEKIQIINCDIRDLKKLKETIKNINPKYIFHLAADTSRDISLDTLDEMIDINLMGTLNVLKSCVTLPSLESLVVIGTSEEYGNSNTEFQEELKEDPITPYSFSKTCSYYLCKLFYNVYNVPFVFLRPSLIYGPNQPETMFIPSLIGALKNNKEFKMTKGDQIRNFIYIDDAVKCVINAAFSKNCIGEIIDVGNENIKIIEVARMIGGIMGKNHLIKPGEINYRDNEIMTYYLNCKKMEQIFNWKPQVNLMDGLKKTIQLEL